MYFYIVTVVYNHIIPEYEIINVADDLSETFIFVDNSSNKEICVNNRNICLIKQFCYISMQGNHGLPKAYNKAIERIPKDKNTWIIICDQDTEIANDFLQYYKNAIESNPGKRIFCPIVKDSVGIMSPSKIIGKKFVHSEITDFDNALENYSFINSCMCINSTVFESIKYDENLFLDCVDHDFVKTVRKNFSENLFYVISDLEVFQNFSGVTKNSLNSDITRFQIYLKDARYFYSKWYKNVYSVNLFLFFRALKLSFTHKTPVFLKQFLNTIL